MPQPRKEWRVDAKPDVLLCRVYGPTHEDGYEYGPIMETSDHALAHKIVRAMNSYETLVRLLERAADALDDCSAETWSHYASTHPLAREIRRKLKGELPLNLTTSNSETLASFVAYCTSHPDERFWQALRNWSMYAFIIASNKPPYEITEDPKLILSDTFYWERRRAEGD